MIVYLDSSVILRIVLREQNPLAQWNEITEGVTSTLTRVEAARTLDRNAVLDEAARPLPLVNGALDAIHLASAVLYREGQPTNERPLLFATHDLQLARAARAMHFEVLGA